MAMRPFSLAVIGAGQSDFAAAIMARKARLEVTIFGEAPELAGTWYYNFYPRRPPISTESWARRWTIRFRRPGAAAGRSTRTGTWPRGRIPARGSSN